MREKHCAWCGRPAVDEHPSLDRVLKCNTEQLAWVWEYLHQHNPGSNWMEAVMSEIKKRKAHHVLTDTSIPKR
jgi:hypothetical protein